MREVKVTSLPTKVPAIRLLVELTNGGSLVELHPDTPVSINEVFAYDYDRRSGRSRRHNAGEAIDPLTERLAQALFRTLNVGLHPVTTVGFARDLITLDKRPELDIETFMAGVAETIGQVFGLPKGKVTWTMP